MNSTEEKIVPIGEQLPKSEKMDDIPYPFDEGVTLFRVIFYTNNDIGYYSKPYPIEEYENVWRGIQASLQLATETIAVPHKNGISYVFRRHLEGVVFQGNIPEERPAEYIPNQGFYDAETGVIPVTKGEPTYEYGSGAKQSA